MGRKLKERLDYFPMDVDMFRDPKIMRLIRNANGGAEAVTVYTMLLCRIYEQGYWVKIDSNLTFTIAVDANLSEERVIDVIGICVHLGLFDAPTYEMENVLTSHGIQERYLEIKGKCKNKATINEYCLISSEEMNENEQESTFIPNKCPKNDISSEEMSKNEQKTEFPLKNKEKEKDKNINSSSTTSPAREGVDGQNWRTEQERWYVELANDESFIETAAMQNRVAVETIKMQLSAFYAEAVAKKQFHNSEGDFRSHAFDWIRRSVEIAREKQQRKSKGKGSSSSGGKPAAAGVGVIAEKVEEVDRDEERRKFYKEHIKAAIEGSPHSKSIIKGCLREGTFNELGLELSDEEKQQLAKLVYGKEVKA